uniref:exonuclease domain-containing protein n=1 Tax=Candidatus Scatousia sp. TaxID=3085663 RepID=UPI0040257FC3
MEIKLRNKGKSLCEFPSDYTVIDIETTGLSPQKCEIIEISALRVRDDNIVKSFS